MNNWSSSVDTRFDSKSAPTSFPERIDIVDILRGFALIGVIVANFQSMISWDDPSGTVNAATVWFLENLVSGKFYRLFAFLFGLGFALQMARLESRGVRFVPLYVRRLMILGLIGIAHGILFWPNDILALFAQFGLLLLLMRRVSNKSIAIIAIACLLAPHAYYYASTGFADFRQAKPAAIQEQESAERTKSRDARDAETHRIRSTGTYREVVDWNTSNFMRWHTDVQGQFAILSEEFLMFLLGLFAGRRRLFEYLGKSAPYFRKVMWWSLLIGVATHAIAPALYDIESHPVHGHLATTARLIVAEIEPAALALFYATAVTLLIRRFKFAPRLKPVAALGRMALTNYLLLSIVVTTLFYNYGLGLYEEVTALTGVALAIVAFVLMILTSSWWLGRFRFGPAEWMWRSLTYGKFLPIRSSVQ